MQLTNLKMYSDMSPTSGGTRPKGGQPVVREHQMMKKAVQGRRSLQALAAALRISEYVIRYRLRLLDGVCNQALWLLDGTPVSGASIGYLRLMKPARQVEVAEMMIGLNDYSTRLAQAMFESTPRSGLSAKATAKERRAAELLQIHRGAQELASMRTGIKLHEANFGAATLQLTVVKRYAASLLENVSIVKWLAMNRPGYLERLQAIADFRHLPLE